VRVSYVDDRAAGVATPAAADRRGSDLDGATRCHGDPTTGAGTGRMAVACDREPTVPGDAGVPVDAVWFRMRSPAGHGRDGASGGDGLGGGGISSAGRVVGAATDTVAGGGGGRVSDDRATDGTGGADGGGAATPAG
jgi:hypothetical protein